MNIKNKIKQIILIIPMVFMIFFAITSTIGCKTSEATNWYDINGKWTFSLSFNSNLEKNQILKFAGTEESGNVTIDETTVGTYTVTSIESDDKTIYNVEIFVIKKESYQYYFLGKLNNEFEMSGSFSFIENGIEVFGTWSAVR